MSSILIVDDEKEICELLQFQFESMGWSTDICHSGNDAIEKLKGGNYNAVLSDIKMANGSGLELLDYASKNLTGTPVVLMTGYEEITEQQAIQRGAKALVSKPMNTRELISLIQSLV